MRAEVLSAEMFWVIRQDDLFFYIWSAIQLVLLIEIAFVTPFRTAFTICAPWGSFLFNVDLFIDTYFLIDIALNFFIVETDHHGVMEYTHAAIARRYLRGCFVPDSISSAPTSFVILFAGAESLGEHRLFLRVLRFVRLFKLVKLIRFKEKVGRLVVDAEDEHIRSTLVAVQGAMNTLKYILMLLYLAHLLTCCWYAAGCTAEWDEDNGFMEGWVVQEGWYEYESEGHNTCLDGQRMPIEEVCSECVAIDHLSAMDQRVLWECGVEGCLGHRGDPLASFNGF